MKEKRSFEDVLENNPLRQWVRDLWEVRPLRKASDVGRIPRALHVACGKGDSTQLIKARFGPERLCAVDKKPELIELARTNHANPSVEFSARDVLDLGFEDASFDAVFNLAELHNYSEWRKGVAELGRVLKPGGLLLQEELTIESFTKGTGKIFRNLTEHPYDDMFTLGELLEEMRKAGFAILHAKWKNPFLAFRYAVIVARKN